MIMCYMLLISNVLYSKCYTFENIFCSVQYFTKYITKPRKSGWIILTKIPLICEILGKRALVTRIRLTIIIDNRHDTF